MTSHGFSPNRIDTLIGASTRIDGDIDCTGVLRVQGEVKGDVVCREAADGGVVVDSAGGVAGTVTAPHIVVKGRFAGPAHSSQTIEVHQGGSLTGDVAFRHLVIHAGGVVEGALTPTPDDTAPGAEPPRMAPPADVHAGWGKRKLGIAAGAAVAVIAVVWAWSLFSTETPSAQDAAPATASSARESAAEPAPAARDQARREERASESAAAEPAAPALVPAATLATAPSAAPGEETVVVRGANPNRPVGVFLLVAHEPAVLYRKQRDDAGGGTRLAAEAGEKVSISVDRDELVRVAKGRALEIYFQGQKVPRDLVERGVWISFVPTSRP